MRGADIASLAAPLVYLAAAGIVGLFLWSGLRGEHGLAALADARTEETRLAAELASVRAERAAMANKVRRLGRDYLDLDLLDERAREVLGLARPDEVVIRPVSR